MSAHHHGLQKTSVERQAYSSIVVVVVVIVVVVVVVVVYLHKKGTSVATVVTAFPAAGIHFRILS